MTGIEVSCVMPCLNEENTVGLCVRNALDIMDQRRISGEVIVADNGSTDNSVEVARTAGARIVIQAVKGYGVTCMKGISETRGAFIIMADADGSYDWTELWRFIYPLREGYDLVMGTRFKGEIMPGAMPRLHRYIGSPLLAGMLKLLYHTPISDPNCGMRSFTRLAFEKMKLHTPGMEFASEMIIKAALTGLKIAEIPITLYKDGRNGKSHLRTFRDGMRHLRILFSHVSSKFYPEVL